MREDSPANPYSVNPGGRRSLPGFRNVGWFAPHVRWSTALRCFNCCLSVEPGSLCEPLVLSCFLYQLHAHPE